MLDFGIRIIDNLTFQDELFWFSNNKGNMHWIKQGTSNNNSVDGVGAGGPDVLGLTWSYSGDCWMGRTRTEPNTNLKNVIVYISMVMVWVDSYMFLNMNITSSEDVIVGVITPYQVNNSIELI